MADRSVTRLVPVDIGYREAWLGPATDAALAAEAATLVLPPALERAVDKRQREFLVGRVCARDAIRIIAPERAGEPVLIGDSREPLWPAGLVGSLTHSHGFVAAAVGHAADYRGIGIDSERIIAPSTAASIAEMVATPAELEALVRSTGLSRDVALTLVFSAKESIFKCLYPLVGRYFDFLEAALEAADLSSLTFRAKLLTALSTDFPAGFGLQGRFEMASDHVLTGICLTARGPANHR